MLVALCNFNDRDIVWLQCWWHYVISKTETLCDYNDTMIVMSNVVIVKLCNYNDRDVVRLWWWRLVRLHLSGQRGELRLGKPITGLRLAVGPWAWLSFTGGCAPGASGMQVRITRTHSLVCCSLLQQQFNILSMGSFIEMHYSRFGSCWIWEQTLMMWMFWAVTKQIIHSLSRASTLTIPPSWVDCGLRVAAHHRTEGWQFLCSPSRGILLVLSGYR